ncbi:MAG: hypothetical protein Fur0014_10820 [Rubrivivax sp.]
MFWSKKAEAKPLGVPLGDLQALLAPTSIRAKVDGNTLIARHEHCAVRVEVVPPGHRESDNGPIRAVVRVLAELPAPMRVLFEPFDAQSAGAWNGFAALGALYADGSAVRVGSRLTIYEAEDAWAALHLPLLLFATICGSEAIAGALRRTLAQQETRGGVSHWGEHDFEHAGRMLSRLCACTHDGGGLTAEFALRDGAVSAAAGDRQTALFQLMADQPHPELGGGLFCLLQMPHRVGNEDRLHRICAQLNAMEMAPHDLPPHFGAWCPGRLGDNPAYVSFLPNALHAVAGIALNVAIWAMHRAQWAAAMLAAMGVRS